MKLDVKISINGCNLLYPIISYDWTEVSGELWLFSVSLWPLNKLEQNKVICKIRAFNDSVEVGNHTDFIKWVGVNVDHRVLNNGRNYILAGTGH